MQLRARSVLTGAILAGLSVVTTLNILARHLTARLRRHLSPSSLHRAWGRAIRRRHLRNLRHLRILARHLTARLRCWLHAWNRRPRSHLSQAHSRPLMGSLSSKSRFQQLGANPGQLRVLQIRQIQVRATATSTFNTHCTQTQQASHQGAIDIYRLNAL